MSALNDSLLSISETEAKIKNPSVGVHQYEKFVQQYPLLSALNLE